MLKKYHPLWVNTHFNHPREFTASSEKALAKLADAALRAELDRLKREFNDGKDFPQREDDLRGGRPIAA